MSFVDDDLPVFFSGLDELAVTFGGVTVNGYKNVPFDMFAGKGMGGMESQQTCVEIPANAFSPMPLPKQTIVVGGTTYNIVSRKFSEDGRVMSLELAL